MKKILFFLIIISLLFAYSLPVVAAKTTCKAKLMTTSRKFNKKLTKIKKTNETYNYSIYYSPKWEFSDLEEDWYQFVSPYTKFYPDEALIGSLLVVNPFTPMNGGGPDKGPALKEETVKINGKDANWKQWWNDKYCFEEGKITFINTPAEGWKSDNFINYILAKPNETLILKSMIYSIKFN